MIKDQIVKALQVVTGAKEINLESPENEAFGDYSTNVAMILAKKEKRNPRELAQELSLKFQKDTNLSEIVEKVEVAGPGFINFWLKKDVLVDNLIQIDSEKEEYGISELGKGKLAIVEYSSPNIAKPFTIGHLRSTIIGDAIANLLSVTGWKVMRDNHLGDWGTQFGKMIYAIKTWGNEKQIAKSENPVRELVTLYVKFHEEAEKNNSLEEDARKWFKKLEDGDTEARRVWKECVDWSFVEFDRIYKILGVSFSKEFEGGQGLGESFFESRMKSVIDELKAKKLLKVGEEGAKLVFFKNDKYPPAMILKKDGATLYHTRDLATDKYRLEKYNPDLIINEVGSEQTLYFQQLFEIERLLGWFKEGQRVHISHGLVRFEEGKMSTRKGNVIWMEDVLEEAKKKATALTAISGVARSEWGDPDGLISRKLKVDQDLSSGARDKDIESIAIGALKYNDLKRDPKTEIVFDWDEILNMEGNSGPYLQYTVVRINSVLARAKDWEFEIGNLKLEIEELGVLRALIKFPEAVSASAFRYAPNIVCNYLYDLAQKFNYFYNKDKIIGSENEGFRLKLTSSVGQVLKNGLNILGIEAPERM